VTVSADGLVYVATFTLRVWTCVALLALVVLTTRFSEIVAALGRLGVPATVVWLLVVTYRYLFLFLSELRRLLLARESRTVGRRRRRDAWTDAGRLAGTFLLRTVARGERVHRGMCARGGARPPSPYRRAGAAGPADVAFVATGLLLALAAGVGRWLL
jgi:cobalt/nickel transport system permease protein